MASFINSGLQCTGDIFSHAFVFVGELQGILTIRQTRLKLFEKALCVCAIYIFIH